jgi:hypothetical protein
MSASAVESPLIPDRRNTRLNASVAFGACTLLLLLDRTPR